MSDRLSAFSGVGLNEAILRLALDEHAAALPRLQRLWDYYRNPAELVGMGAARAAGAPRPYRLAQERGLPPRITGPRSPREDDRAPRREVVVENDIAWRIHTMVDFMFGKPVLITSTARDERTRRLVQLALDAMWEAAGGISLLQDLALLGHVYGHADLLLRTDDLAPASFPAFPHSLDRHGAGHNPVRPLPRTTPNADPESTIAAAARTLRIDLIEPTRGIPLLDPADYRRLRAYLIHFRRELNTPEPPRTIDRLFGRRPAARRRTEAVTEIIAPGLRRLCIDDRLAGETRDRWLPHDLPVVHIQNIAQPFRYEGLGEVEPLIPLQDELNTRLSDRASRVTLQSFKMYLAKGLDGFERAAVGPGQIWSTDNPDAQITAFGGDADSPSERDHIGEVREALDKLSGVPPLASGVVRAKIGNLTSANALRVTLLGLLARTARKRITYGRGIAELCRLALTALHNAGVLRTDEHDRRVRLEWPDPLPADLHEQALAAKTKQELGVPPERLLAELGYSAADPGIT